MSVSCYDTWVTPRYNMPFPIGVIFNGGTFQSCGGLWGGIWVTVMNMGYLPKSISFGGRGLEFELQPSHSLTE